MCLIVFAWKVIPACPLLAAANRDEFFDRPAQAADWWQDHPHVYAGRDLQAGGTWMGVNRRGSFAALTNIRNGEPGKADAPSRGALVANFLQGDDSALDYLRMLSTEADRYNGFNLIIGDAKAMYWYSNQGQADQRNAQPLAPGVYGLSNGLLDAPWPKVIKAKAQFGSLMCQGAPADAYFDMLSDTTRAADFRLPQTGVSLEWERLLSPICIESPQYGTRVSTLVQLRADQEAQLMERTLR